MPMKKKLLAVYLGGRADRCNTELHDVVFVVGESIEATYHQLMDQWFGDPLRLHIDSWMELNLVDEHRISLTANPGASEKKLYFINLGAYQPGEFTELHANAFLVASSATEAKQRAKSHLLRGALSVHTDDLYDVDDCLEIAEVSGLHIQLEPTSEAAVLNPQNGYHIIPPEIVATYAKQRQLLPPEAV
ncbi:MAG TPA: DUF1543 domain-containing protein [Verrucomicrobiae bacterium]|jgi:hypothetical protein|nr:DUF1543 domain-containing protein [Verrucomicrobiae bacterium]